MFADVKKAIQRKTTLICAVTMIIFVADKNEETTGQQQQQQEEECMWAWSLDLERSVALAAGRCLGGMLQGPAASLQEKTSEYWLSNVLLRNGLEMDFELLGRKTLKTLSQCQKMSCLSLQDDLDTFSIETIFLAFLQTYKTLLSRITQTKSCKQS